MVRFTMIVPASWAHLEITNTILASLRIISYPEDIGLAGTLPRGGIEGWEEERMMVCRIPHCQNGI